MENCEVDKLKKRYHSWNNLSLLFFSKTTFSMFFAFSLSLTDEKTNRWDRQFRLGRVQPTLKLNMLLILSLYKTLKIVQFIVIYRIINSATSPCAMGLFESSNKIFRRMCICVELRTQEGVGGETNTGNF